MRISRFQFQFSFQSVHLDGMDFFCVLGKGKRAKVGSFDWSWLEFDFEFEVERRGCLYQDRQRERKNERNSFLSLLSPLSSVASNYGSSKNVLEKVASVLYYI